MMKSLADIRRAYKALDLLADDADGKEKRRRGTQFEDVLRDLLELEGLSPRTSYRPRGEEIDGSFVFHGRVFLLEAKWTSNELPASSMYMFKGKVDGKLVGTIGVFISMAGYSNDSVDALGLGKTLNVILFDRVDFEACLQEGHGFRTVFETKLRYAAERGIVHFSYKSTHVSVRLGADSAYHARCSEVVTERLAPPKRETIVIICEGHLDQRILTLLSSRILSSEGIRRDVLIMPAMGKLAIPALANGVKHLRERGATIVLIADSDGDYRGTYDQLTKRLEYRVDAILVIDPTLEAAWLFRGSADPKRALTESIRRDKRSLDRVIEGLDLAQLQDTDKEFQKFVTVLTVERTPDELRRI
jgi:hypothetical protein